MTETSTSLIACYHDTNRVCPIPSYWNALWEMLPESHWLHLDEPI